MLNFKTLNMYPLISKVMKQCHTSNFWNASLKLSPHKTCHARQTTYGLAYCYSQNMASTIYYITKYTYLEYPFHFSKNSTFPFFTRRSKIFSTENSSRFPLTGPDVGCMGAAWPVSIGCMSGCVYVWDMLSG